VGSIEVRPVGNCPFERAAIRGGSPAPTRQAGAREYPSHDPGDIVKSTFASPIYDEKYNSIRTAQGPESRRDRGAAARPSSRRCGNSGHPLVQAIPARPRTCHDCTIRPGMAKPLCYRTVRSRVTPKELGRRLFFIIDALGLNEAPSRCGLEAPRRPTSASRPDGASEVLADRSLRVEVESFRASEGRSYSPTRGHAWRVSLHWRAPTDFRSVPLPPDRVHDDARRSSPGLSRSPRVPRGRFFPPRWPMPRAGGGRCFAR
jgi:hypothetical protein